MTSEKRTSGPKTLKGKARSSQNAKTHGLTSVSASSANEKALIEAYSKELFDYYDPQSPLEKLQIERIATCRAKLQYLYEIEQLKLALAAKELEATPEKILEKIPDIGDLAKGMAKELILYGQIYLPCRLNLPLLETICEEITHFSGVIEDQHQFARALPQLTKYLNGYPVVGLNNEGQWIEKLAAVTTQLQMISKLEKYGSREWSGIVEGYLLGKEYEAKLKEEAMQPHMDELERYQEERRIAQGQKPRAKAPDSKSPELSMPDGHVLHMQLGCFTGLLASYREAERGVAQYKEIGALMKRSISLPVAESDLLMRYQTALERRLSSAIGELLALQRVGK